MIKKALFLTFGGGIILFYLLSSSLGWEFANSGQPFKIWDAVYLYGFSWRKIMLNSIFLFNILAFVVKLDQLLEVLVTTLIFVSIGLIFFAVAYAVLSRAFPIRKEIEHDQNTALGVVIGSIMIGIAIIIAAAIHG
jgi:hypothetical protein